MALLIDPKSKTITEVEFDGIVSTAHRFTECGHVTTFRLPDGMGTLIVDEDGMLKSDLEPFYMLGLMFVGKALLVGNRRWTEKAKMDLALAQVVVRFKP